MDQAFPRFVRTAGLEPGINHQQFFYPDMPGKPCRILFLDSPPLQKESPLPRTFPCLLICGCTNSFISLWGVTSKDHHSLGYIGGKDPNKRYHDSEISTLYKPIHEADKITFYSGDTSGCITGWIRQVHGDGINYHQDCRGTDFVPLFHVRRNELVDWQTCSIVQLSTSIINHVDDSSSSDVADPLLVILAKDVSNYQMQVLVYDRTIRKVIKSYELVGEESYEYILSASLSPDGSRYVMGGSNLGRLYLWDCIRGYPMKVREIPIFRHQDRFLDINDLILVLDPQIY